MHLFVIFFSLPSQALLQARDGLGWGYQVGFGLAKKPQVILGFRVFRVLNNNASPRHALHTEV